MAFGLRPPAFGSADPSLGRLNGQTPSVSRVEARNGQDCCTPLQIHPSARADRADGRADGRSAVDGHEHDGSMLASMPNTDHNFLEMMIAHHSTAIGMAAEEHTDGANPRL